MVFSADPDDPYKLLEEMRTLGLVVARGPSVMLICPMDGALPFLLFCRAPAVLSLIDLRAMRAAHPLRRL